MLREAAHTVVFIEHDPTLFDQAMNMLEPLAGTLKDLSRDSLVVLYTPVADRTFLALARRADRFIEFIPIEEDRHPIRTSRLMRQCGLRLSGQRSLEVS